MRRHIPLEIKRLALKLAIIRKYTHKKIESISLEKKMESISLKFSNHWLVLLLHHIFRWNQTRSNPAEEGCPYRYENVIHHDPPSRPVNHALFQSKASNSYNPAFHWASCESLPASKTKLWFPSFPYCSETKCPPQQPRRPTWRRSKSWPLSTIEWISTPVCLSSNYRSYPHLFLRSC